MRIGYHPHKDQKQEDTKYLHQVIIPVFIPNEEGYFKDAFIIFQNCLQSLLKTAHEKTFITIVNNGCCNKVVTYLNILFEGSKIHELIHTSNIGKLNAILKGLAGNNIGLVTISDADVLFKPHWQQETCKVFNAFPKAGVVGLIPQFKLFESNCGNIFFDTFFSKKVKFANVENKNDLVQFYESIGWDKNYNPHYLEKNLKIIDEQAVAIIGAGHVVATYKKELFETIKTYIGFKMGGNSESYLDKAPLYKGMWRLTTNGNFAYHMGNVYEHWMQEELEKLDNSVKEIIELSFQRPNHKISKFEFFIKNKLFSKLFSIKLFKKLFYKYKKLPKEMISNY